MLSRLCVAAVDTLEARAYRFDIMRSRVVPRLALALALTAWFAGAATAQISNPGFTPQVPISGFAQPKFGIDPSRLGMSTTLSFGSGFGGTSDALQVTRLSYQFRAPIWMSVSVGSQFGNGANRMNSAFFLEGLDFSWKPNPNMMFQVHYQDVRSPLQYRDSGLGYIRDPYVVR